MRELSQRLRDEAAVVGRRSGWFRLTEQLLNEAADHVEKMQRLIHQTAQPMTDEERRTAASEFVSNLLSSGRVYTEATQKAIILGFRAGCLWTEKSYSELFSFKDYLRGVWGDHPKPELPQISWIKNDPEKFKTFYDGSRFLVALRVRSDQTKKTHWEFDVVTVRADGGPMSLEYGGGESYHAWDFSSFEYFHLLEGPMPTDEEVEE